MILNIRNNIKYIKENLYNIIWKKKFLAKLKHFNEMIYQKIYLLKEIKYINPRIVFNIENNIQL